VIVNDALGNLFRITVDINYSSMPLVTKSVKSATPADKETPNDRKDSTSNAYCCYPDGCDRFRTDPICIENPGNAVRVICSNESCQEGSWMHSGCFSRWEDQVLGVLGSCGRARSWSDKQRQQNIWTKKGYDLAYKACNCKCGKGHLRKDVDYQPHPNAGNADDFSGGGKRGKKLRRKSESSATASCKGPIVASVKVASMATTTLTICQDPNAYVGWNGGGGGNGRLPLRLRTASLSSTGSNSSPPNSADTPSLSNSSSGWHSSGGRSGSSGSTPGSGSVSCSSSSNCRFDFFADAEQAALGCIFKRRSDYSAFLTLPRCHQNPYHIKTEDEGPYGNDETRCFVLTSLSSHKVTEVQCVVCALRLQVYDKYPLVDGTFFLSPQRYISTVQASHEGKLLYLNAVCVHCMYGAFRELRCLACHTAWSGRFLLVGSMYAYDVFSAVSCCSFRAACKNCQKPVVEGGAILPYFSDYSRNLQCPHCKVDDCHFVKPLDDVFAIRGVR
jgi:hypothetical protein